MNKKMLTGAFGYVCVPALLLGDYLTGHPAFLYVAGFFGVMVLFFVALVGALLVLVDDAESVAKAAAPQIIQMPMWKKIAYNTIVPLEILYLLYAKAFFLSTLFILIFIIGLLVKKMIVALGSPSKE